MVRSIAANHGLVDGNKRLATTVLNATLLVNGYVYMWGDDDAVALALRCAKGETAFEWLAEFIEVWTTQSDGQDVVDMHPDQLRARMAALRAFRDGYAATRGGTAPAQDIVSWHARGELSPDIVEALVSIARSEQ